MTTFKTFTKDNIIAEDLLGALDHELQDKVTGVANAKPLTVERQVLHTKIVKDPDIENITDANEYKMKEIKYQKWKKKQSNESSLKDIIFAAIPTEYQDLIKSELNIKQHSFAFFK